MLAFIMDGVKQVLLIVKGYPAIYGMFLRICSVVACNTCKGYKGNS
jgi:hypothetical protein